MSILAELAALRPGGGESYSGGGGFGGSGGGGGGGSDIGFLIELIYWIVRLCIEAPWLAVVLVGGIILWIAWSAISQWRNKDWDSGPPVQLKRAVELQGIRSIDSDFSQVVFEDFAYRLFSAAHRARVSGEALAAAVGPYVSASARQTLADRDPGKTVEQVIVGALRTVEVEIPQNRQPGSRIEVVIEFEANILTKSATSYVVESWRFGRDAAAKSKAPGATKTFPCPNCGAPWQSRDTGSQKCASCGEIVDNGRFDWVVESIELYSEDERPPTLTTEVPERGTNLPTVLQKDVEARARRIKLDEAAFEARLRLIYDELNKAWSANDIEPVRGLVSDGLYDYLAYWVDAYKRQGLRNALADMKIIRTQIAKVQRDRWYHAVTVRVWGIGKDYVVENATGKVVRGSKRKERAYTEYWTLIRSAEREGSTVHAEKRCGNCGAPLDVTMAGTCAHCGSHVTAGEFDWVVSKIEQDDSYRG